MTYTKPEISLLGNADQLVQNIGKPSGAFDGVQLGGDPSYNLDE